jgi:hypothetical protein
VFAFLDTRFYFSRLDPAAFWEPEQRILFQLYGFAAGKYAYF